MRVQQRADDALAGLVAWEETSLADLRAELARDRGRTVKAADAFRDGALKDFKEVLGELRREGEPQEPEAGAAPAKGEAKPAATPQAAAPKPAQAPQSPPAKAPAKANT